MFDTVGHTNLAVGLPTRLVMMPFGILFLSLQNGNVKLREKVFKGSICRAKSLVAIPQILAMLDRCKP